MLLPSLTLSIFLLLNVSIASQASVAEATNTTLKLSKEAACRRVVELLGPRDSIPLKDHPDVKLTVTKNQCIFKSVNGSKMPFSGENAADELIKIVDEYSPAKVQTTSEASSPQSSQSSSQDEIIRKLTEIIHHETRREIDRMLKDENSPLNQLKNKVHLAIDLNDKRH